MKRLVFVLALVILTLSNVAIAQNVGINSDGSSPDASAMLDVSSTSSGFLAPRMTRDIIFSTGLSGLRALYGLLMVKPTFITIAATLALGQLRLKEN